MTCARISIAVLVAWACAVSGNAAPNYAPFTENVIAHYQLSADDIKHLQFYLDSPMVLDRTLNHGEKASRSGHALRQVDNMTVEEVTFKQYTPGIAENADLQKHVIAVSFEKGATIDFCAPVAMYDAPAGAPFPFRRGDIIPSAAYHVCGSDRRTGPGPAFQRFTLMYGGHEFNTAGGSSLDVDQSGMSKFEKKSRTVKGRTVD